MQYQKIWDKVLRSDEKVELEFSIGKRYRMFYMVSLAILGLPFLFTSETSGFGILYISSILFYFGFYLKAANAYAFTDKRVLVHKGWLSTSAISIDYDKITDVVVQESFLGRILTQTGTLSISTAGTATREVILTHIKSPYEVRKKLDEIRGN